MSERANRRRGHLKRCGALLHRIWHEIRSWWYKIYSFLNRAGYTTKLASLYTCFNRPLASGAIEEICGFWVICIYCEAPDSAANFCNSEKVDTSTSPEHGNEVDEEANFTTMFGLIEFKQSIIRCFNGFGFAAASARSMRFCISASLLLVTASFISKAIHPHRPPKRGRTMAEIPNHQVHISKLCFGI
jgi:hypothetical protein